ncbi:MAG: cupin [Thermodesulfobacteriota bacterium]
MKRVDKPWGYELWWAVTEKYVGKILHVMCGHSLSYQYHKVKDESLYLRTGEIFVEIEEQGKELKKFILFPGESLRIVPFTKHRMTALADSELFEVSTPEIDDIVRLEDRYGRE